MSGDVSASTQIEDTIDCYPQIILTLSAADISAVTSTGFSFQLAASDTADVKPGSYRYGARATIAGSISQIKPVSDLIRILPSVFENSRTVLDYGG